MSLRRLDQHYEEKLDLMFPPHCSNDELRARLAEITDRYRKGGLGRAGFALVTAVFVAFVLPPLSAVQMLGILGVGVLYLVTRSVGNAKIEELERRVESMIQARSETGRIDQGDEPER